MLEWLNLDFGDFKLWHRNQTYSVDKNGEAIYPLSDIKKFIGKRIGLPENKFSVSEFPFVVLDKRKKDICCSWKNEVRLEDGSFLSVEYDLKGFTEIIPYLDFSRDDVKEWLSEIMDQCIYRIKRHY